MVFAFYIKPVVPSPVPYTEQCADPAKAEEVDDAVSFIHLKPEYVQKRMSVINFNRSMESIGKNSSMLSTLKDSCDAVWLVLLAEMSSLVYELHEHTSITSTYPEICQSGFTIAEELRQKDYELGGDFVPAVAVWTRE